MTLEVLKLDNECKSWRLDDDAVPMSEADKRDSGSVIPSIPGLQRGSILRPQRLLSDLSNTEQGLRALSLRVPWLPGTWV